MARIDFGTLTDEQVAALAKECLDDLPDDDVIHIIIAWSHAHDAADELISALETLGDRED